MAKIGSLFVDLGLKTARFEKDFKRANSIVAKFKRKTASAMKSVVKSIFSLKGAFVGLAGAAGIGLLIKSSLNAIDKIGKMSSLFKISTEDIGAMSLAAQIGGTDLDTMLKAARNVSRQMFDFSRDVGEAKDAMKLMGITAEDINPLMDDQLKLMAFLAENVNAVTNSVDRLAIAQDLFGGRATVVLNALKDGVSGMEAFRKEAELLGGALSGDAVRGVEAANDSLTRLGFLFTGMRDQIVAALAPAIEIGVTAFKNWIIEIAKSEGGIKQFSMNAAISILNGIKVMVRGFESLLTAIDGVKEKLIELGVVEGVAGKKSAEDIRVLIGLRGGEILLAQKFGESQEHINEIIQQRSRLQSTLNSMGADEVGIIDKTISGIDKLIAKIKEKNDIPSAASTGTVDVSPDTAGITGSTEDALSAKVDAISQSLLTEEQRILESYERRALIVSEANARGLLGEQATSNLLTGIWQQHEDQRAAITKRSESAILSVKRSASNNAIGLLSALGQKNKVFAAAAILITKVMAIKQILAHTQVAAVLAFSSQLIPGVPSTYAAAAAAYTKTQAMGKLSAGLVAASGAVELAGLGGSDSPAGGAPNPDADDDSDVIPIDTAQPRESAITVIIQGDYIGGEDSAEKLALLIDSYRDRGGTA